ncbi:MAG: response regulator transcription factor [Bifidobacteriaceae bacterium]|jgi:two-component system OmpR family response regulator|nr:response regulator transcription factor [Bifidobacteriaceae bacterium]
MNSPLSHAQARLLVVDDEPNLRDLLTTTLKFAGFEVLTASTGGEAVAMAIEHRPDLIVLDVMLPDMDGFAVTKRLREGGEHIPVVFLTARDQVADKVRGLTVGGDDYVTKPFSLEEVVARIRTVLRRAGFGEQPEGAVLRVGDVELDEDLHEVYRAGVEVKLSPTEFKLLRYLMANAGHVLSKAQILDHVWEYSWSGDTTIVESYISYLRRRLDVRPAGTKLPPFIETRRGVGYLVRAPRKPKP